MRRTSGSGRTAPAGISLCNTANSDDNGVRSRPNWCVTLSAEERASGHQLSLRICRDDSGPGTLTYSDALETDFAVLTDAGQEVWRWSADHSDEGPEHVLDVGTGQCLTWTTEWADVDRNGDALPPGTYTLVSTTFARELQRLPEDRTDVELR
jgi:hypothetical protein